MKTARGTSVLSRIAIGPLQVLQRSRGTFPSPGLRTPAQEWARFEAAREGTGRHLAALYDKAVEEAGEENAFILIMHREILYDTSYVEVVREAIEGAGTTAEHAVAAAEKHFVSLLGEVKDPYVRERAEDVRAVSQGLIQTLCGSGVLALRGKTPAIVVADSLSPGETVQMDRSRLLGIVTHRGSLFSHTSILARTMGIPALVGLEIDRSWDGHLAVLDGTTGCLHVDPTPELLARARQHQQSEQEENRVRKARPA